MSNGNGNIVQPQFAIPHSSATVTLPYASEIEKTMWWLDRVAIQNYWTTQYSTDPLINSSGFNWKRHNGSSLETFVPESGETFKLTGYPINSSGFWENNRKIIQFVGDKSLKYFDLYGMNTTNLTSSRVAGSGYKWPVDGDDQWKTYGNYIPSPYSQTFTLGDPTQDSFVDFRDSSKTKYMLRHGKLGSADYKQYTPTTATRALQFFGPYTMSRRASYARMDHNYDGINSYSVIGGIGNYSTKNTMYNSSDWELIKNYVSGHLTWTCDDSPSTTPRAISWYESNMNFALYNYVYYLFGLGSVGLSGRQVERHELGAGFEESFSFALLPLSRKPYAYAPADTNHYSDIAHYLSSFTGFSRNDTTPISYKIVNISLSGSDSFDAGGQRLSILNPLVPVSSTLIYGYLDFNAPEYSGYFRNVGLSNQITAYPFLAGVEPLQMIGDQIRNKIITGNYQTFSRHPMPNHRTMTITDAVGIGSEEDTTITNNGYDFSHPYPLDNETDISGYLGHLGSMLGGYQATPTKYNTENSTYGTVSGIIHDFTPPGNVLWIALINNPFDSLGDFMSLSMPVIDTIIGTSGTGADYGRVTHNGYGVNKYSSYSYIEEGSGMKIDHQNSSYGAVGASTSGYKTANAISNMGYFYSDTKLYDIH